MLHIDPTDKAIADRLADAVRLACATGKLSNLVRKLAYLDKYGYDSGANPRGVDEPTRCRLFVDFSPASFQFTMDNATIDEAAHVIAWRASFCGGLVYHGSADGFGSGGAPAFAVTLNPCDGWAIHT